MADSNRIVFPDEVEKAKVAAATAKAAAAKQVEDKTSGGDTNALDAAPEEVTISMRNVISVPSNCPPGYQMGNDGVCREVFN